MTIGIYKLYNKVTDRFYLGKSNNIEKRIQTHFTYIRKEESISETYAKMHEDYKKYGKESFEYKILEECTVDQLGERETYWAFKLDIFNSDKSYNTGYEFPFVWKVYYKNIKKYGMYNPEEFKKKMEEDFLFPFYL